LIKFLIVTEIQNFLIDDRNTLLMNPDEFIKSLESSPKKFLKTKIINLCKNYSYLSKGYYVSLLAEAKGLKCIPNITDIIKLNWKRNYELALPEINATLNKYFNESPQEPLIRTYTSFFGRHENPNIEPLARVLFDLFRFPILSFEIEFSKNNQWRVNKIETVSINTLIDKRLEFFFEAIKQFTGSAWRTKGNNLKQEKYWIAILHDPNEKMPPSDKVALKKFISIGKKLGLWVELISKNDFSSLLEFDALFLRQTTAVNNVSFKFASKAELEDIPCIDDTQSIIKCCNKVFLHTLMSANNIPTPKTIILDKKNLKDFLQTNTYPCVLKIPDGSFSNGIFKIKTKDEMQEKASEMLRRSEIVICQEFVESNFDWRIGVLNGEVLFAIKYFMAKDHWQIYNHQAKQKKDIAGKSECVAVENVPQNVIDIALKACSKIGKSLYGVDIKELENGQCLLIEVNDNPNIDSGVEDKFLGDLLYEKILKHLVTLIEN
jgi:glutathione synthase/RimK-type ligase-like ATP-grasp enzyme